MKTFLKGLLNWIKIRVKNYHARPAALRRAIRKAKRLQKKNKKRYRVYFLQNRYQALSRPDIKQRRRNKEFQPTVNVTKMEPLAFYDTLTGLPEFSKQLLN